MTKYAIQADGIGKEYHIGGLKFEDNFIDLATQAVTGPFRRAWKLLRGQATSASDLDETFWALRDVSFDVKHGEVVGIIGANGAGKSTLLKVLSRITYPTEGRILLNGRIGALLEVGTGFHQELTGRENIYLNGSIIGMSKAEIDKKFDEIVDFAEVEQFIDTPIKHYSSGMKVRLAFAVAAHLEPEILVIDEVLAVGDASFQRKSLGKMNEVAQQGRTVLFVSHNMSAVNNLCERGIVLDKGRVIFDGGVDSAVNIYMQNLSEQHTFEGNPVELPVKSALPAQMREIGLRTTDAQYSMMLDYHEDFEIELSIEIRDPKLTYYTTIHIQDSYGNKIIFTTDEDTHEAPIDSVSAGIYRYVARFPGQLLKPGTYYITAGICQRPGGRIDKYDALISFEVFDHDSRRAMKKLYRNALIAPIIPWNFQSESSSIYATELEAVDE